MSYELYLSHMFVVLGVVAAYRAALAESQTWTFIVYLPALVLCYALGSLLQRFFADFYSHFYARLHASVSLRLR
ncbi:hypothetical protein ACO0LO_16055 [Undibacterium sp. TJN25]|uniref:hypothetical protein n=1 Tax=Undibacterium sp. TJN25 TaxID=3413056 RepID=UPI003BF043CD